MQGKRGLNLVNKRQRKNEIKGKLEAEIRLNSESDLEKLYLECKKKKPELTFEMWIKL